MKLDSKNDFIQLPIVIIHDKEDNSYVGHFTQEHLTGCLAQADTEEKLKEELLISLKSMIQFWHDDSNKGRKLSILRYNKSPGQFWFTIIGIGLTLNWLRIFPEEPIVGITKAKGFRMGKLLIFLQNHWKKQKKIGEKGQ